MRPPLVLLGALAALVCGSAVALLLALLAGPEEAPPPPTAPPPARVVVERAAAEQRATATTTLRTWDAARARAWASGDLRALAGLYTDTSLAGRRDVAMLQRWRERGLRVRDLRTQVLAVEVERADDERVVLLVTDRVAGGVAVGRGRPLVLPHDQPDRRRLTLMRDDGAWRVAAVVPLAAPPGAAGSTPGR